MATYNEIIYNLSNLYDGGIGSDDDNISNDQLIWIFNQYRAKLIREDLNKKRSIDPQLVQNLGCVELECVDASECCDVKSYTTILRSKEPLPKSIEGYNKNYLLFVGSVDKRISYLITTETQARWGQYNKYTGSAPKAYIRDDDRYLYVINAPEGIEVITVDIIAENPEDAEKFSTCSGEPCFNRDMEYPISAHMIPIINSLIIQNELRLLSMTNDDITNNTKDDTEQAQPQRQS
jgi:hypothetical protein